MLKVKETEAKDIKSLENNFSASIPRVYDRVDLKQVQKPSLNASHLPFVLSILLFYYHVSIEVNVMSLILFYLRKPG